MGWGSLKVVFRFSLAGLVALAVLPGKSHASEPDSCKFLKIATVPIVELADGIAVPVSLNGREFLMEIGTGSPLTYLFKNMTRSLSLETLVMDAYNSRRAPAFGLTKIDSLAFGGTILLKGNVYLAAREEADQINNVSGVLGEDFLKNFDVDIDIKNKKFTIFQTNGCSEKSNPLSPDTYSFISFEVVSQDYWPRPMLSVGVNGRSVRAMFGTEYADTRLSEEAAKSLGIDLGGARRIAADLSSNKGGEGLWMAQLGSFNIGEETIKPVKMRIGGDGYDWQEGHWEMVLGRDFLRAHHVLISHSQKRFYYSYVGGPVFGRESASR